MIPIPRPGTRHGDCPNCGYRPEGLETRATWMGRPIIDLLDCELLEAYANRLQALGPITEADGLLMSELVRRGLRLHP